METHKREGERERERERGREVMRGKRAYMKTDTDVNRDRKEDGRVD